LEWRRPGTSGIIDGILKKIAASLPEWVGLKLRALYRREHWGHPILKKFGTVQDLYYWVADGNLDTVLPLQNYFSAFFPELDTSTVGNVSIFDNEGRSLGVKPFSMAHCGGVKFRVSSMLQEMEPSSKQEYGTLEVNIEIPSAIHREIRPQISFYFWDRFYIGYTNAPGQISFVHGVDKANIYRYGQAVPTPWYETPENRSWAPETPVDIDQYSKYTVIMINRTRASSDVDLTLADNQDNSQTWHATIQPTGVHRFELTPELLSELDPKELRIRIDGMASHYGRPMVFKEFPNGAMSAMHC
jgi:hypothetical protein